MCRLWFYCMGFRADWKAMVALFNLQRNYNVNEAWVWKHYVVCGSGFLSVVSCVQILLAGGMWSIVFQNIACRFAFYVARQRGTMVISLALSQTSAMTLGGGRQWGSKFHGQCPLASR